MSVVPVFSARAVMRKLGRAGFRFVYVKGSHHFFHHPVSDRITSVPLHGSTDIGRGLLRKIIKQAGLTIEEFLDL